MVQATEEQIVEGLKAAMRRLAATVTIVTATDGNTRHGMTVTAVTSVTMSPPTLLVCINRRARLHQILLSASAFCVNILHHEQIDHAVAFAGAASGEERFSVGHWSCTEDGVSYLVDAQANVFCKKVAAIERGSHTIFIGEVTAVATHDVVAPLVYQDATYCKSVPSIGTTSPPSMSIIDPLFWDNQ
jgi:flavin reductase (DIM6/NTAB) family NADH-FMN oxidoreductase RutF